jgi:hypothetical protein
MRNFASIALTAALLCSTTSAMAAENEGALTAADPQAAQTNTVVVPGFGTLTGAQAALFLTLIAAGVAVAVAFGTASSSASTTL